jgi:SAM-dependent methyltransferase
MKEAEFDKFADEYHALLSQSIRASGEDPAFFAEYKVRDVAGILKAAPGASAGGLRILDFGSGSGNSTGFFRTYFPSADIVCLDVSRKSLGLAQRRLGAAARFVCFDGGTIPFAEGSFDVVFTACVFHHIPADSHVPLLSEIRRVLRPGGSLFLFEHNPLNPLTRQAVDACAFDEDAVLIRAPEMRRRVRAGGFAAVRIAYRIFFPRALAALRPLERFLASVPIGAQYYLHGTK